MKFRTEYETHPAETPLNPELPIVTLGSCFADYMSARMRKCLWDASNPLGVLFNPLSILRALEAVVGEKGLSLFESSLFESGETWKSWLFDSSMGAHTREECIEKFTLRKNEVLSKLRCGKQLCVTFGTSFIYGLCEGKAGFSGTVGNCHKQSAQLFARRFAADEYVGPWIDCIERLQDMFPGLTVVFTLSPVRHIRDGLTGNSLSKAALRTGIEKIVSATRNTSYFGAYEILCDDLRDYRFYGNDLVHPSEQAVEYIWEKFIATYIPKEGTPMLSEGEKLAKRLAHRVLSDGNREASLFRENTLRMLEEFKSRHPHTSDCDFSDHRNL